MNMPTEPGRLGKRIARRLLGCALRIWPEQTSTWGRALAAELSVIDNSGQALRWAIGGVKMLVREWLREALGSWRRPVGVAEGSPLAALASQASRVPRTPRFLTALLLCASLGILLIPDSREAMKGTFQPWLGPLRSQDLQRFRQAAERHHDPEAMAIVAMLSPDPAERIPMADRAVKLDPSLTWIYADVPTAEEPSMLDSQPMPPRWIARLENWDPDNAFVHMLGAQQRLLRLEDSWQKSGYRGDYLEEAKKRLPEDPAWSAAMESAFEAPKYDSYFPRKFDAYRNVVRRYGIRDLRVALILVTRSPLPFPIPTRNAEIYSDVLLERAAAAEKSGRYREAIELSWQPVQASQHMAEQCHTDFEKLAWAQIERSSLARLEPLLAKTGQAREATFVRYRLSALQTDSYPSSPVRDWAWSENGWEGFAIRGLTLGLLLLTAAFLAGCAVLLFRGRYAAEQRGLGSALASAAVDYCPLLLLLDALGLFIAYRPVALMYERFMNWTLPVYDFRGLVHALFTPYEWPDGIDRLCQEYLVPYNYWMAAIIGLSILAAYIVFRGTLGRRNA
jgi:hypothetical protein